LQLETGVPRKTIKLKNGKEMEMKQVKMIEMTVNVDCIHCQAKISMLMPGFSMPEEFLKYPPPDMDCTVINAHCSKHFTTVQHGNLFASVCIITGNPTKDCYE
jgi:hypothetical protein